MAMSPSAFQMKRKSELLSAVKNRLLKMGAVGGLSSRLCRNPDNKNATHFQLILCGTVDSCGTVM